MGANIGIVTYTAGFFAGMVVEDIFVNKPKVKVCYDIRRRHGTEEWEVTVVLKNLGRDILVTEVLAHAIKNVAPDTRIPMPKPYEASRGRGGFRPLGGEQWLMNDSTKEVPLWDFISMDAFREARYIKKQLPFARVEYRFFFIPFIGPILCGTIDLESAIMVHDSLESNCSAY